MGLVIIPKMNMFAEVEKRLKYRFWDKERQRSNRAAQIREEGARMRRCWNNHNDIAWSGPEHNPIRVKMGLPPEKELAYVCITCGGAACDTVIKDMGWTFDTIPDWEIKRIMDMDLLWQAEGNARSFFMPRR